MNRYKIERLCAENMGYLEILYASVYNRKAPKNYFQLKYNTGYTGVSFLGYFALDNDKPIAYYGIIPTRVSISKKVVLASQSCDTMTHPDYRHRGLFVELAKRTFQLASENGIHFVFGFPNQNSYPAFIQKLGFVHTETMARYELNSNDNVIKKVFRKIRPLKTGALDSHFKNPLIAEGFDGVFYDPDYLEHRKYTDNSMVNYGGDTFWIHRSSYLMVGAMQFADEKKSSVHLSFLRRLAGGLAISFITSKGTALDKKLSVDLQPLTGFPVIIKNLSNEYVLDRLKFQLADIDIF